MVLQSSLLFLLLAISAVIGTGYRALPPKDVYTAVLINESASPVTLLLEYQYQNCNNGLEMSTKIVSIPPNSYIKTPQETVDAGGYTTVKVLKSIKRVEILDDLSAPFSGVDSPQKNWQFIIDEDHIESVGHAYNVE
ncbi:unnamed protein product [Didymodactylos carnosus]|uniref:Uncharacterized protein n=1 Tax=Didymodactylos carnosus TaxID=1234261 RepID=A0A814LQA2_9BILA|nr:unnamed protein product [Didymodactylos carnosus]CAF1290876.1 unnamed protein product [Didymodactylos carnosus]CAF3836284.1 unnamed protein product [Didymodactylos carnosus]CAF4095712.1 unnamed protein product [Didymodactylos carnosus]